MPSTTLGPTAGTIDETTKTVNVGGISLAGTVPADAINVSVTAIVDISITTWYWEDYWINDRYNYYGDYGYYGYGPGGYSYHYKYDKYYIDDTITDSASTTLTYDNGQVGRGSVQFPDYWSNNVAHYRFRKGIDDVSITYVVEWEVAPPPPTLSVSVSPGTTVPAGTTVTVSWSSANAASVSVDGSAIATSGSFPVTKSTGTSTVTFVATGTSGSNPATTTERVTISWLSAPNPTISLSASPPSPQNVGTPVTLSWSTSNATRVVADGADTELNGSRYFTDLTPGTYTPTFTVYGGPGSTPQTASLTYVVRPLTQPSGSVSYSPSTVEAGQTVTINATAANATSSVLRTPRGDISFTGSMSTTIARATQSESASVIAVGQDGVSRTVATGSLTVYQTPVLEMACQPQANPGATISINASVSNIQNSSGTLRYTLPSLNTGTIVISTPSGSGSNTFSVTAPSTPGTYEIRGEFITSSGSVATDSVSFTVVDNTPQPLYGAPTLGSLGNFTGIRRGTNNPSNTVVLPVGTLSSRGFRPGVVDLEVSTPPAAGSVTIEPASTVETGNAFSIVWNAPSNAVLGQTYTVVIAATQAGTSGTSYATASFRMEAASGTHPADYGDWQLLNQELGPDSSPVLGPPADFSGGNKTWDMTIVGGGTFTNGQSVFQYPESGRPAIALARSTAYDAETTKTITIQERGVASTARTVTARVKTKVYVPPAPGAMDFFVSGTKEPEQIVTTNTVTLTSVTGTRNLTVTPLGDSSIPSMSLSELYESVRAVTINGVTTTITGAGSFPLSVTDGATVSVTTMSAPFDPGSATRTKSYKVTINGGVQSTAEDTFTVITRAPTRDPGFGTFDFDDLVDLNPNTRYESNSVLITEVDPSIPVTVTVAGDSDLDPYIVVAGVNKGTSAVVYRGDAFKISAKTSPDYATEAQFSVTLANRVQPWKLTTRIRDITPSAFNFPDIDGCERSTPYETITQRIAGVEGVVNISVNNGAILIINGTNTGSSTGSVTNGDQVSVLATSSSNFSTPVTYRVTIEGVFDDFIVTTRARSTGVSSLNGLTNAGHSRVLPRTRVISDTITLSGFDDSLPISCSTANLYVNGVLIPEGSTTVTAGDTVYLTFTTGGLFFETFVHTLTVGAYTGNWTVKTVPNFDLGVMADF